MVSLSTVAAMLLPMAAVLSATPVPQEGRWIAGDNGGEKLQFTLIWGSSTIWVQEFARSELRGVSEREITSPTSTPVSFRLEREAGVFEFEGGFKEGTGTGKFIFQPRSQFVQTLRSLRIEGADRVTDRDLMLLALRHTSTAVIQEFTGLSLGSLSVKEVVELAVHGVTPEYVRSLRSVGLSGTNTVSGLVEMRLHRITREYIRELEALGYRNLPRHQLLQMGIHGVSREQIQGLERVGYRDLSPRQLVAMRIHGVTPAFIREMREVGFQDLSPEALVEMRVHRVSARYIRELESLGYRSLSRRQLLQMGLHGVTPAFIRNVREAGFCDLLPERLVRMRIHGTEPERARGGQRCG